MRLAENTERKKVAKNRPSGHHRTTLSGYIFATKARSVIQLLRLNVQKGMNRTQLHAHYYSATFILSCTRRTWKMRKIMSRHVCRNLYDYKLQNVAPHRNDIITSFVLVRRRADSVRTVPDGFYSSSLYVLLHTIGPTEALVSSVASRRHRRSAEARKLVVRRTRTVLGARDFAVSSAVVWNSLPAEFLVSSLTVATFARHLKTHLFSCLN